MQATAGLASRPQTSTFILRCPISAPFRNSDLPRQVRSHPDGLPLAGSRVDTVLHHEKKNLQLQAIAFLMSEALEGRPKH